MREARSVEVKVCGMREAGNIARIAELQPDYLGFVFVPESPRYVGDNLTREILDFLPRTISTVGVFRNQSSDFIVDTVQSLDLRVVQLHGAENSAFVRTLKGALPSVAVWRAVGVSCSQDVSALDNAFDGVDRFVLDSGAGGTGHAFDWEWLREYRAPIPFVLAGGIGVTNIDAALNVAGKVEALVGVDINSRVESEPGVKDFEKIKNVMDKVRNRS